MQDWKPGPDGRFLGRLSAAMDADRLPNGILIIGDSPQCLGATLDAAANLLLSGELFDFFPISPSGKAQQISAESVREVVDRMHLSSRSGGRKVAAIYGADRLHVAAANALLKTLEEPPPHTFFLLSARRVGDVLPTICSRCHVYHCCHVPPFERNGEWDLWLDSYCIYVRKCLCEFGARQVLDAYALLAGFLRIIDSVAVDGQGDACGDACEGPLPEMTARRIVFELMLADCSLRLAKIAKSVFAEEDGDCRRRLIVKLARFVEAVDDAIWLMGKNYGEIAAVESFLLPQGRSLFAAED
ncbi:MAG: hypothetical protein LBB38_03285 [Puniceicoccales bacterium]|jgi:hypothetical protein|nr:hypothetical protein [Puniceicoccales bacterium]